MIIYDKQTTPLLHAIHRLSGTVRTGKSQAVRNMTTAFQMQHNAAAIDLQLTQAVSEIAALSARLEIGVPEIHEFEIVGRELSCVHGIVEKKLKFAVTYEYRFIVVFRDEVMRTLRDEFGMTERRWKQLIESRITA